ncbi:hypothetical protein N7491_005420 [Penicillium cf. griseofulvum]|uniref:Uncharacterized protein n=1 Tax=Penicillium cf. griseofulvum TaxID=2972120 RepID=A0A9W9J4L3_9EURO|nr:hypothetical protein N7472_008110 [Penicillium cf. griseofulvum]KAJ5434825.1 hypothetical protein N7491_005420 [Penicillium cf. griseofulvum]KAJ5452657.1 hypothetical protein N7445_000840 [Penicillium cf. griseofulvum]
MAHGRPGYLVSQTIARANRVLLYFWVVATFPRPHREATTSLRLWVRSMSGIVLGECHEVYEALGTAIALTLVAYILIHLINLSLFFSPLFYPNLVQLYFTVTCPISLQSDYFSVGLKQKPEDL